MPSRVHAMWVAPVLVGLAVAVGGCVKPTVKGEELAGYVPKTPEEIPSYVVEPPDSINIQVTDDSAGISRGAQLRPDGRITMPLLNDVSVTGLTPLEIREKLTKLYEKYLKQVDMTVTVTSYASKVVYIFREPGQLNAMPYTGSQDLLKTLARAGGPGPTGASRRLMLVRASTEKPLICKINLNKVVREGLLDEAHNPTIQDGDIIYIPMDVFSWVGYQMNKLMAPFYAAFQPVRMWDTWQDVLEDNNE